MGKELGNQLESHCSSSSKLRMESNTVDIWRKKTRWAGEEELTVLGARLLKGQGRERSLGRSWICSG